MSRFLKINAAGLLLPADATDHVAVQEVEPLANGLHRFWSVTEAPKQMTQPKCVAYAKELKLAGFSDWRLSTRIELLTLVDDTKYDPAIDTDAFPHCKSSWYWTDTLSAFSPGDCAWFVFFLNGNAHCNGRGYGGWVRGVRVGPSMVAGPQP